MESSDTWCWRWVLRTHSLVWNWLHFFAPSFPSRVSNSVTTHLYAVSCPSLYMIFRSCEKIRPRHVRMSMKACNSSAKGNIFPCHGQAEKLLVAYYLVTTGMWWRNLKINQWKQKACSGLRCTRLCIYVYMYVSIHIYPWISKYICIYIYVHLYVYAYIHTYMYVNIYICIYIYIYIHVYVHMYVYMYIVYMYIYRVHKYSWIYIQIHMYPGVVVE